MNNVPTPNRDSQSRTAHAVNSGPLSDRMCARNAPLHKQRAEPLQDALGVQLPLHVDRQVLPRVLVNDRQHPEGPPLVGAVLHKIVCPYMVLVLGPQPDARAVVEPQPRPFGLLRSVLSAPPSARSAAPASGSPTSPPSVARPSPFGTHSGRIPAPSSTILSVRACSSAAGCGSYLCVVRGCFSTRHARRSETPS